MLCVLCDMPLGPEKRTLHVQGKSHSVHKTCLRKATQNQLIEKGLIRPDDKGFWTIYGGNK